TAVLVLDVKTWPSNTRLAKMIEDAASIVCKAPAAYRLPPWCVQWAASRYGKQLSNPAATMLVDLIGAEMGLLDQELQKLAIYVDDRAKIDLPEVDKLDGNSRAENTFKIFDAIGAGDARHAHPSLDRLFTQGEEPTSNLRADSM